MSPRWAALTAVISRSPRGVSGYIRPDEPDGKQIQRCTSPRTGELQRTVGRRARGCPQRCSHWEP